MPSIVGAELDIVVSMRRYVGGRSWEDSLGPMGGWRNGRPCNSVGGWLVGSVSGCNSGWFGESVVDGSGGLTGG